MFQCLMCDEHPLIILNGSHSAFFNYADQVGLQEFLDLLKQKEFVKKQGKVNELTGFFELPGLPKDEVVSFP